MHSLYDTRIDLHGDGDMWICKENDAMWPDGSDLIQERIPRRHRSSEPGSLILVFVLSLTVRVEFGIERHGAIPPTVDYGIADNVSSLVAGLSKWSRPRQLREFAEPGQIFTHSTPWINRSVSLFTMAAPGNMHNLTTLIKRSVTLGTVRPGIVACKDNLLTRMPGQAGSCNLTT
jgi:hypothetical protein